MLSGFCVTELSGRRLTGAVQGARIRRRLGQPIGLSGPTGPSKKHQAKGEPLIIMRERDREIKRRRHRYQKRKKLRQQLGAADAEAEQQKIEAKIRKTYPSHRPAI
jgi:hypothetical protein